MSAAHQLNLLEGGSMTADPRNAQAKSASASTPDRAFTSEDVTGHLNNALSLLALAGSLEHEPVSDAVTYSRSDVDAIETRIRAALALLKPVERLEVTPAGRLALARATAETREPAPAALSVPIVWHEWDYTRPAAVTAALELCDERDARRVDLEREV